MLFYSLFLLMYILCHKNSIKQYRITRGHIITETKQLLHSALMYSVHATCTRLRSVVPPLPDVCSARAPQEVDIGVVRVGGSRLISRRGHGLLGILSCVAIPFPILRRVGVVQDAHSDILPCELRDRDPRLLNKGEGEQGVINDITVRHIPSVGRHCHQ